MSGTLIGHSNGQSICVLSTSHAYNYSINIPGVV